MTEQPVLLLGGGTLSRKGVLAVRLAALGLAQM